MNKLLLFIASFILLTKGIKSYTKYSIRLGKGTQNYRTSLRFSVPSKLKATVSENSDEKLNQEEQAIPEFVQQLNKNTVELVKYGLVLYYGDRFYARFAALETIARVPYFAYTSVLHLYETLGWFRKKEYIKLHFAESWNELHHLLIMESLGGTKEFGDRFVAQHIAFFYYWIVVFLYMVAPSVAYNSMMYVERHAFDTYDKFLKSHGSELKLLPAPQVAIDYYQDGDLSLFDSFQYSQICHDVGSDNCTTDQKQLIHKPDTSFMKDSVFANEHVINENSIAEPLSKLRRPKIMNLYDVFYNICLDEAEHAQTMDTLSNVPFNNESE